ncbi:MAG: VCBS repeat-containing protein [Nanoarchaeota archaeon]|nr:VCBS repeat-containing protein [Nanoarchaeota archaeon]
MLNRLLEKIRKLSILGIVSAGYGVALYESESDKYNIAEAILKSNNSELPQIERESMKFEPFLHLGNIEKIGNGNNFGYMNDDLNLDLVSVKNNRLIVNQYYGDNFIEREVKLNVKGIPTNYSVSDKCKIIVTDFNNDGLNDIIVRDPDGKFSSLFRIK